jgi:molybdopterin/thiamine biosynthesis adenylyltransferase
MHEFDRVEPETETHRTEKALKQLIASASLPLRRGHVVVRIGDVASSSPGGQRLITLFVHLLARMKGIVRAISIIGELSAPVHVGVPLVGTNVGEGLEGLAANLDGPLSKYRTDLDIGSRNRIGDLSVAIGTDQGDLVLGSDGWRVMTGECARLARWDDSAPFGPYMAATVGAAEVFKCLLKINFGWSEGARADNILFSLANFGVNDNAAPALDVGSLDATGVAIAGAGAGGSAALYTLAAIPKLGGKVVVVEPGYLKESNLGRYLMSDYRQVHQHAHKLSSVRAFMGLHARNTSVETVDASWRDVKRQWDIVICTVDTAEARRDVQLSRPRIILEAGVVRTLYAVLRVTAGGWCLECKFPPDPDITLKRRSTLWGVSVTEVLRLQTSKEVVSKADVERLAAIQGRPASDFEALLGMPFRDVPSVTECGETPLSLRVPSQAPVLPLTTTAAGIVLAAEVAKECLGIGSPLLNTFDHDLRYAPKAERQKFRRRREKCLAC